MINFPYVALRLFRRLTPAPLAYWLLSNDFRNPFGYLKSAEGYLDAVIEAGFDLRGRTVVEIGAGSRSPAGLALLMAGAARVYLQEPFLRPAPAALLRERVQTLFTALRNRPGLIPLSAPLWKDDDLNPEFARWLEAPADKTPLPDASVDLFVSTSVLEHIRDIAAVFQEEFRLLKPGGGLLHRVDLRDHIFRWPFEMLTFSVFVWENILTTPGKGGGYQNRFRIDDYERLLQNTGFTDVRVQTVRSDREGFERIRKRLPSMYRDRPERTLSATGIVLSARKHA